MEVFKISHN